jgi:hypothetical protein
MPFTRNTPVVQGNLNDAQQDFLVSAVAIGVQQGYSSQIGRGFKVSEANIHGRESERQDDCWAETIFEGVVDPGRLSAHCWIFSNANKVMNQGMCNTHHTLHGACAAYLLDMYVFMSVLLLLVHIS